MTAPTKFYGWKLLTALWFMMFAASLPMYSVGVLNTDMARALGFDGRWIGLGSAAYTWISGVPGPFIGMLVARKGVRFSVLIGLSLITLGSLLMATTVHAAWGLPLVFGVVVGLGVCSGGPIATQTAVTKWFVKRKALALSLLLSGSPICGLVAPNLARYVIDHFGHDWRSGWWTLTIFNALAVLVAALFVRESPADLGQLPDGAASEAEVAASMPAGGGKSRIYRTADDWTFGEVLRCGTIWLIVLSGVGYTAGYFTFLFHGVAHLENLGHSPAEAALSISILAFVFLFGNLAAGALGDYIEPRLILAGASVLIAIGLMLAIYATGPMGIYLYAIFLGVGSGAGFTSTMTLPANYFGLRAYPSTVGLMSATGTTIAAIATSAAGYIDHTYHSYTSFFVVTGILSFLGFIVLMFVKPPVRKAVQPLAAAAGTK